MHKSPYMLPRRSEPLLFISVQVFETVHVVAEQRISKTRSPRVENLPYGPSKLRPIKCYVPHEIYEYSSKGIRCTALNVTGVSIALNDQTTFWN